MNLAFHWFLPTYGDSRNLVAGGHETSMQGDRPATLKYQRQLCAAAETNGFEAVLTPTGVVEPRPLGHPEPHDESHCSC